MKKTFRNIILMLLAVAMILSFAACGSTPAKSADDTGTSANTPAAEETASPAFTYTSSYSALDISVKDYVSILSFTDEGFYCTYEEVVGEEIPEGVIPQYEGEFFIREPRLMFIRYDGTIENIENYSALPRPKGSEEQYSYSSSVYLNGLTVKPDGNLIVIEGISESWNTVDGLTYDDPDYWITMIYTMKYYLRELGRNGAEISSCYIDLGESEDTQYISSSVILDDNGNLVLASGNSVKIINTKGETVYTADLGSYIDSVARTSDGSIYVSTYTENGFNSLRKLNQESKTFGEEISIPYDAYSFFAGGGDYPLYYTSGQYFYGLDPESGNAEKVFNWISMDINPDTLGTIGILSDGRIVGINSIYSQATEGFTFEKFEISKIPYEAAPQKTILKLATLSLGYNTRNAVVKFNRANPDYKIEVVDYSEFNSEEDTSAGLTKLSTELMAGAGPDLIELTGIPTSQFAAKGIFEDLYPFIDSDPEMSREDFFENILASQESDGKLISTVSGFAINAVVGASSLVGDTPGWNYSAFSAALAELRDSVPEAEPFDSYTTRDSILYTCLGLDMDHYVDWKTGKCSFDSEEFISLLEFVNTFPAEFDWDNYDWSSSDTSVESRTSSGMQMLATANLYTFDDVFFLNGYFGGKEQTFIGYPTADETAGNMITVDTGIAMVSRCSHKDAAWKFLRTFFTEDYQANNYYFPSSKALFDKKLKDSMTVSYQKNSAGEYQLDESGEKIPVPRMGTYNGKGELVYFYALTQEQADKVCEIVNITTKIQKTDDSILDIVTEQAAAYFSGQKSAQEVAKLIQSKANIFVNEQR